MSLTAAATVSRPKGLSVLVRVEDARLSVTFASRRVSSRGGGCDQQVHWSWTHVALADHDASLAAALAAALKAPPADWLELLAPRRPALVWRHLVDELVDRLAGDLQEAIQDELEAILADTPGLAEPLD